MSTHPLLSRYDRSPVCAPYSEILDPPLTNVIHNIHLYKTCTPNNNNKNNNNNNNNNNTLLSWFQIQYNNDI